MVGASLYFVGGSDRSAVVHRNEMLVRALEQVAGIEHQDKRSQRREEIPIEETRDRIHP